MRKPIQSGIPRLTVLSGIVACVLATFLPITVAVANGVAGLWETTGFTRVDVTPINAPGLQSEHTVDIADSTYRFNDDGSFAAGDISGSWRQAADKYFVAANRVALESQYRQMLEAPRADGSPSDIVVNDLKLVKSKLLGKQLDNGILGTESYEYKLDLSTKSTGRKEVIRVIQTVQMAGLPPENIKTLVQSRNLSAVRASETTDHAPMAAAVAAVINFMHH